jgi:hypothetical protein
MYTKLFGKILDSSIWLEPDPTRLVWITLLAAMDEDGFAHFSAIQNLADRAKVSLEATQAALETFQTPDPNSANPANEGRRIERVPGGWMILNAAYYRELFSRAVSRERTRERVARFRAKSNGLSTVTSTLPPVSPVYVFEYTSEFESFWNIYPVRKAKGQAYKAWQKLNPDSAMQAAFSLAIESQKQERAALSKSGQFVPEWKYAGTWLNGKCWLDEPMKVEDRPKPKAQFTFKTDPNVIVTACRERGIDTVGKTREELLRKLNV